MPDSARPVGVVVVTHGQLAAELLNAAEMIVGDLPGFAAVSIGWHDDVTVAREAIANAIERVQGRAGVLLLTDMFGGTPSNISLSFLKDHPVEVVTGVNLPMLIKLATGVETQGLEELATFIKEYGRRNISVASEILPGASS